MVYGHGVDRGKVREKIKDKILFPVPWTSYPISFFSVSLSVSLLFLIPFFLSVEHGIL